MTDLQVWLKNATRGLCSEAADQVRREIEDHYHSAREAALDRGVTPADADRQALAALGEAEVANDRYAAVLLTKEEAKMLRGVKRDDQFFGSRPELGRAFRLGPVLLLFMAVAAYKMGAGNLARIMLAATLGVAMIFTVPTFSIYTPARSQVLSLCKVARCVGVVMARQWPSSFRLARGRCDLAHFVRIHRVGMRLPPQETPHLPLA